MSRFHVKDIAIFVLCVISLSALGALYLHNLKHKKDNERMDLLRLEYYENSLAREEDEANRALETASKETLDSVHYAKDLGYAVFYCPEVGSLAVIKPGDNCASLKGKLLVPFSSKESLSPLE